MDLLTEIERSFNRSMALVRVAVEWGFGKVIQQFAFLDFAKNLKIGLQPVGKFYSVATFLTNCKVCLGYGQRVADYFGIAPPNLALYTSNT